MAPINSQLDHGVRLAGLEIQLLHHKHDPARLFAVPQGVGHHPAADLTPLSRGRDNNELVVAGCPAGPGLDQLAQLFRGEPNVQLEERVPDNLV